MLHFVDGILSKSIDVNTASTLAPTGTTLLIGGDYADQLNTLSATIRELRLWNVGRDSSALQKGMKRGSLAAEEKANLVAYWPLDGNSPSFRDLSLQTLTAAKIPSASEKGVIEVYEGNPPLRVCERSMDHTVSAVGGACEPLYIANFDLRSWGFSKEFMDQGRTFTMTFIGLTISSGSYTLDGTLPRIDPIKGARFSVARTIPFYVDGLQLNSEFSFEAWFLKSNTDKSSYLVQKRGNAAQGGCTVFF